MKAAKILALVLSFVLLLSLCACGEKSVQIANPMADVTPEALIEDYGLDLTSALRFDGAAFYRIASDDTVPIGGVKFTYNGDEYDYRVSPADGPVDISGLYYDWTETSERAIGDSDITATVSLNGEGQGIMIWYDPVSVLAYSLAMTENADADKLADAAALLFTPVMDRAEVEEEGDEAPDDSVEFSEAMVDYLRDMHENYHPGTAGSSLTAARYAATLADLFAKYSPDPEQVKLIMNEFGRQELNEDSTAVFVEQLGGIVGMFNEITEGSGYGMLSDSGYEPEYYPWPDEVAELVNSLDD